MTKKLNLEPERFKKYPGSAQEWKDELQKIFGDAAGANQSIAFHLQYTNGNLRGTLEEICGLLSQAVNLFQHINYEGIKDDEVVSSEKKYDTVNAPDGKV